MQGVELTISIVNTNNKDLLKDCLESIYETTKVTSFEIIVVDNVSTDGSVKMVETCFPEVRLIVNETRRGYGYNHNRACEISRGTYFLVFNEDMIVLENAMDMMVETLKADESVGVLGCRLLNPDHSMQVSCIRFDSLGSELFKCLFLDSLFPNSDMRDHLFSWDHDSERDVDAVGGSCMLIPRTVIEDVGLFDEQFFVYEEETDLCKRIRAAGWTVRFTPKAEVIHYGGQTSAAMSALMSVVYTDSVIKFFRKHHGAVQGSLVSGILLLRALLRLPIWTIMNILKRGRSEEAAKKLAMHKAIASWLLSRGRSLDLPRPPANTVLELRSEL